MAKCLMCHHIKTGVYLIFCSGFCTDGNKRQLLFKCEMTETNRWRWPFWSSGVGGGVCFPECVTVVKMSTAMLRSERHEFILLPPREGSDEAAVTVFITARNNGSWTWLQVEYKPPNQHQRATLYGQFFHSGFKADSKMCFLPSTTNTSL